MNENPGNITTIDEEAHYNLFSCSCGCTEFHYPEGEDSVFECDSCGAQYQMDI